ncbi:MAG: RdgB/HAM1 family non-canonical purine NTP pyrophosphatase [Steroidobacteraceae bacterium]|nr:RdgB/HAM1 family non-canonical purine NTP pyrophosphatase [Steroidobacteraceae bacterium]MDW8258150.1 RdgB/HAM1 family non-canonical purine NTP pyrophosphatase [Gammaproteobacteria bacterium]
MSASFPSRDRPRIVLASGNAGKLAEFAALFAPTGIDIIPQAQLGIAGAVESGATFVANATLKARHAAARAALPALADDSGLEVDWLAGAPGVRSARYAGEGATDAANIARLLDELRARSAPFGPDVRARFRCAIVLVRSADDPSPCVAEGLWEGYIIDTPRGTAGFGYDPIFVDAATGRTAAELPAAEKNRRSHRAQALAALLAALPDWMRR